MAVPAARLVPSKIEPISIDESSLVRQRVLELFSPLRPVTLVSAMPGSGKSVAIRQWAEVVEHPVAWINVDSLDRESTVFWTHLLAAIMLACPDVDEEPLVLLHERPDDDATFIIELIARLESLPVAPILVLDGRVHRLPGGVLDGLARLVDRAARSLHLVLATQVDPDLPVGRWRSEGLVTDVRGNDLQFTDDEALDLAARIAVDPVDQQLVHRLNRAVDGWAVAVRLGLGSGNVEAFLGTALREWPAADRSSAAELGSLLVAMLDADDLDVALGLSVLQELDPAICVELFGDAARDTVRSLLRHDGLLSVVDPRTGTMRFHPLVRRLLENELGWRDPVRRLELHHLAASAFEARGDVRAAYRHLDAVGEVDRARTLLVEAAVEHVDRGDLATLHHLTSQLPTVSQVDRTEMALELGLVAAWGDGTDAAHRWWARATELAERLPPGSAEVSTIQLRLRQLQCMIALLDADLETAVALVESLPRPSAAPRNELELHMTFVATRALVAARHPSAHDWVERVQSLEGPPIVTNVTIPALRAWQSWVEGDLADADRVSQATIAWLEEHQIDVHHWAIDSLITAGWCRLSLGDLPGAAELAQRAGMVASFIPCRWNRVQAEYLSGTVALAHGDAETALRVAQQMLAEVPGTSAGYAGRLRYLAAEAAVALRRLDLATQLVSEMPPGPGRTLLRARLSRWSDAQLEEALAGRAAWPAMHRVRGEALLALRTTAPPDALADLVASCGTTGWVHPLLQLGPRVDRALRALPLAELHPALLAALDAARPVGGPDARVGGPRLTARETSLLELLPTHLTYGEMADRMFLSVNTVKASLKNLYRKLGAHSRTEAVAAAQQHGLI